MSTSADKICNVVECASKSNDDDVCELEEKLQNMNTADNDIVSICANCGKEGDDVNNTCNKCKQVKYCNASCKKKHRHKHKKECEEHLRLVTERAAKLHDEKLFRQPPPLYEDCPICFLMMPVVQTGYKYQSCCGKFICSGCMHAPVYDNQGNKVDNEKCPFCRTPLPSSEKEIISRFKNRMEANDPAAMYNLGVCYRDGLFGFPQDCTKALELWHQSAELGYARAHYNIGYSYKNGEGVEADKEKATHYYELAAMLGHEGARYNLGNNEVCAGNMDRAIKHHLIAIRSGDSNSLDDIKELYGYGLATKEDYTKALQVYQEYLGEVKSKQRDEAAAANEKNRYL